MSSKSNQRFRDLVKGHKIDILLAGVVIDAQVEYARRLKKGDDVVGDTTGIVARAKDELHQLMFEVIGTDHNVECPKRYDIEGPCQCGLDQQRTKLAEVFGYPNDKEQQI
jgi:hypothetical protein